MDAAIGLARIAQYAGGAVLFGTPLFLLYAFPPPRRLPPAERAWLKPLCAGAAGLVAVAAAAYLLAQTADMAGDPAAASDPQMLKDVLTQTAMGWAVAARAAAALMAFCGALIVPAGRTKELGLALLGAVVLLSFAWTGHGAAQEGWAGQVHLAADLLHLLAAGAWVGALVGFALLLRRPSRTPADAVRPLHDALAGFSGVGSAIVALIVVTGLANSWFLVGPRGVPALVETPYGLALTAKLLLFAGMLLLAARNRLRHTPALGAALGGMAPQTPLRALRSSIMLETMLGFGVLALVGVLGLMEPITSR